MKLGLEQLKQITYGADHIIDENGAFYFHRMTEEQVDYYDKKQPDWGLKARSTAGIKFRFKTTSKFLTLKVNVQPFNYVKYFSFDVYVNNSYFDSLRNFDELNLPEFYPTAEFATGDFEKTFNLGDGEKIVYVYFPWNQLLKVYEVEIENGATLQPLPYAGTIITYGDSITQGYYALSSAKRYATLMTESLNLEERCKAIGAETFCPDFLQLKDDYSPNLITVAYGTNDWYHKSRNDFYRDASDFISTLTSKYEDVKIIMIAPIWRADMVEEKPFGDFNDIYTMFNEIASNYKNVYVINARHFVPEDPNYYGDYRLHPNDKGFEQYFNSLKQELDKVL